MTKVVDPLMTATYGDALRPGRHHPEDPAHRDPPQLDVHADAQPAGLSPALYRHGRLPGVQGARRRLRTFDFNFFAGERLDIADAERRLHRRSGRPRARPAAFSFRDPDFSLKSLRGTVVLRWEFRPGSMLYFVWTQQRADTTVISDIRFWEDTADLVKAPGQRHFLLKFC